MKIVFFDTEIRLSVEEVGGWYAASHGEAGMSAAVTILYEEGRQTIHLWDDHKAEALAMYLEEADLVVTFNGQDFDLPLIAALAGREIQLTEHYDICKVVRKAAKQRKGYKLNDICIRTLGRGKTGEGAMAPTLAAQGRWAELFEYCLRDVELTRDLFWYIVVNKFILDTSGEPLFLEDLPWLKGSASPSDSTTTIEAGAMDSPPKGGQS